MLDTPPTDNPADASQAPIQVGQQLLKEIDKARRDIWLISAYLIPTAELEAAIQRAEDRGVQVRILTNSISLNNHLTAHSAYRKHVERLVAQQQAVGCAAAATAATVDSFIGRRRT